jgi:hypothetical protein
MAFVFRTTEDTERNLTLRTQRGQQQAPVQPTARTFKPSKTLTAQKASLGDPSEVTSCVDANTVDAVSGQQ